MKISALTAVVAPPDEPVCPSVDWPRVEERIGLILPIDYKALISAYGSGSFSNFLGVVNFGVFDEDFDWYSLSALEADRDLRAQFPDDFPHAIYPEPGGLFPWAGTDNGDTLYWATAGDPDAWPIFINASRSLEWATYPFGVVEFLAGWLSGRVHCPFFPEDCGMVDPYFYPQG